MNGKQIYPLADSKPVVIKVDENNPKLVISDGFHFTKPINLNFGNENSFCFKVICILGDWQLIIGGIITALFYLLGLYTGFLVFKLLSVFPILCFLFFYYFNRKEFLRIARV